MNKAIARAALICAATSLGAGSTMARASDDSYRTVHIGLTSAATAADLSSSFGADLTGTCQVRGNETSLAATLVTFGLNLLVEEIMEAINRARLERLRSLTENYSGVANFADFAPRQVSFEGVRDCLTVEQVEADGTGATTSRSSFLFTIDRIGTTAIALTPVAARVNDTSANDRARGTQNVSVQVNLNLAALVGGNCATTELNCKPAKQVVLGAPEFAFANLVPGTTLLCTNGDSSGCGKMSAQSIAIPIARSGTPTTVAGMVSIVSDTLEREQDRQAMWERHREALQEMLTEAAGTLVD